MFPAWLSRRRDMQKVKQKQPGGPFLMPFSNASRQRLDDTFEPPTTSFAQALSLHKAISRARDSHLEAELAGFLASRKDPDSSRISYASQNNMQYVATTEHIYAHTRHSQGECSTHTSTGAYSYPSAQDVLPLFCNAASSMLCSRSGTGEPAGLASDSAAPYKSPHSLLNSHAKDFPRDSRRLVIPLQNGANDNDTEGSTILTPDSIESSFGSESSSIGSLVVRKCGFMEESRQCLLQLAKEAFPFGSEDMEGVDVEASSRPCYLDQAHGFAEWQEGHMSEIFDSGNCSLIKGNMPTPDSNLVQAVELRKHPESSASASGVAESHSLLNSDFHHRRGLCTARSLDSLGENSLSLAMSSGPLLGELEVPSSYASFAGHINLIASDMPPECNSVAGNSNSEGAVFGRILCSEWEESSALIAVENPSLMLSSKWQEERVGSCSSHNARSNKSSDRESNACKDGEFKLPLCEWQHDSNVLPMSELKDSCNDLSECGSQDEGNVGCHKSKHDAYIKNGRRHRGSSFSATLPENLQGVVGDSVALVRMSHSPYEDFRQSMYEMIMEQDLEEAPMDVEELLHCYLTLNSPELHPLIKEVFSDVWSSILMNVR